MFRMGKQVESALMAIKALSESPDKGLSITDISLKLGLSKNTLAKVMQSMQNQGILESLQGKKGGYQLALPITEISFHYLLESLGELKPLSCTQNHTCHLSKTCNIKSPLLNWETKFKDYLKETKVSELIIHEGDSHV